MNLFETEIFITYDFNNNILIRFQIDISFVFKINT